MEIKKLFVFSLIISGVVLPLMAREIQREKRIVPALLPYVGQALLPALYNALLATFGAAALAAAGITITQNLRDRNNGLVDSDAFLIAGGIMENNYVTELDLSRNAIEEKGAGYISRAFTINLALNKVSLAGNSIRNDGATLIGQPFTGHFAVTELDISRNGLGFHGALSMREALKKNTIMVSLDISHNRINWEGALVLSAGLECNTTLKVLRLGHNPLTTTGCMDLIDSISIKCTLNELDLEDVNVIQEFRQEVQRIREVNEAFRVRHGQVVASHDILGLRKCRDIHPMNKIVVYMLQREVRPVEFLRMLDKTVSFKMQLQEFIARCLSVGIDIRPYEKEQLINYVLSHKDTDDTRSRDEYITYTVLLASIEHYLGQEKKIRIAQRRKIVKTTKYHESLLKCPLPQVSIVEKMNQLTAGFYHELYDSADKQKLILKRLSRAVSQLRDSRTVVPCRWPCCRRKVTGHSKTKLN